MDQYRLVNLQLHRNGKQMFARGRDVANRNRRKRKLARLLGSESKAELHWQAELAKRLGKGGKITP